MATNPRALAPVLNIGKHGITEGVIAQLERDFTTKELLKVKVLRTFLEASGKKTREIAADLAQMTGSSVVQVVGHTLTLRKPLKRRAPRR